MLLDLRKWLKQTYPMTCLLNGLLFCVLWMQFRTMTYFLIFVRKKKSLDSRPCYQLCFRYSVHTESCWSVPHAEVLLSCQSWSVPACPPPNAFMWHPAFTSALPKASSWVSNLERRSCLLSNCLRSDSEEQRCWQWHAKIRLMYWSTSDKVIC